jgi:Flp pilus assembly protein TadG
MRQLKKLIRCDSGVQAIEFAFVAPILILLLLGVVEVARYIIIQQKVSKAAYQIADQVSRLNPATRNDVCAIFQMANEILSPFNDFNSAEARAGALITAINNSSGATTVGTAAWRLRTGTAFASGLGNTSIPTYSMAPGFTLLNGESAYVVEVNYVYQTIFLPMSIPLGLSNLVTPQQALNNNAGSTDSTINHYSIMRPRNGQLIVSPPAGGTSACT